MCQILFVTRFVIITLLVFNIVIKLYHFNVIRLHNNNNYDHKKQDQ